MSDDLTITGAVSETLTLNMGPQHPSTHGVLRMVLSLHGEEVVGVEPRVGYLHRGFEKLAESCTYAQFVPITDRTDYLAALSNEQAYCLAVERAFGIPVPPRAEHVRAFAVETGRVISHLVWLGTFCLDLGGALGGGSTIFLYTFRERESLLDLLETLTGQRMMYNLLVPGGVRFDLPEGFEETARETIGRVRKRLGELEAMLEMNTVFERRARGVGVISPELVHALGLSGPVARASGVAFDVRREEPYSIYDELGFAPVLESGGDVYARYRVRLREMRASCDMALAALSRMPEGDICSLKPVRAPRSIKGEGECYAAVESPRGELGVYLRADGSPNPVRLKWRAPSFNHVAALPHLLPGHKIADVVSILGSLDPIFGEVDR